MDLEAIRNIGNPNEIASTLIETISLERSIDAELEGIIASNAKIDAVLQELHSQTASAVLSARTQAVELCSSTTATARLADGISRKVRELDAAQSRLRATLAHIDMCRDRSRAVEGAKSAIETEDIEAAVRCIARFLDIEDEVIQNMQSSHEFNDDVAATSVPAEDMLDQSKIMSELRDLVIAKARNKFEEAAAAKDHGNVAKFAALLGNLRLQDEGVKLLTDHVRNLIAERAQADYDALVDVFADGGEIAHISYVEALTNLFRDIAAAMEEYMELLRDSFGPEKATVAILNLHAECDVRGVRILQRFMDHRGLRRLASQIGMRRRDDSMNEPPVIDPRQIEGYLSEILTLCTRGEDYLQFLLLRITEAQAPTALAPSHETSLRSGQLATCLRELLSYYISLEEFYIEESIIKAISIDEPVTGSLTSSMVDDAFFVLLSAGRRALATRRAPSAVSVLNQIHTSLSTTLRTALAKGLQGSAGRLAASASERSNQLEESLNLEVVNRAALVFNNVDVAASYVDKLKQQLDDLITPMFPVPHDRDRLKLVLADLGKASSDFRRLSSQGAEQICTALFGPIRTLLDEFLDRNYELEVDDLDHLSLWPHAVMNAFTKQFMWLQSVLTSNIFEMVVLSSLDKITSRVEAAIPQKRFTQLGGLQLERDIRFLVLGFSDIVSRTVRDKFARLQQTATILGVETVEEAMELANSGVGVWRLSSMEVRQALALRVDLSLSKTMEQGLVGF